MGLGQQRRSPAAQARFGSTLLAAPPAGSPGCPPGGLGLGDVQVHHGPAVQAPQAGGLRVLVVGQAPPAPGTGIGVGGGRLWWHSDAAPVVGWGWGLARTGSPILDLAGGGPPRGRGRSAVSLGEAGAVRSVPVGAGSGNGWPVLGNSRTVYPRGVGVGFFCITSRCTSMG